ncbi:MAG: helix-turn-helix transcriptional regulator [Eggerthellaceae bacterium]|nr:helix-turn-helix transcriptional regulator [Eggerthellaceae bacterium]
MEEDRRIDPERLRRARLSKAMSRQAVAHEVGCLLSRYARIESGAVEPTEPEATKLVSLFGAKVRAS